MNARRWTCIGLSFLAALALAHASTPAELQRGQRLKGGPLPGAETRLDRASAADLLKSYEQLWMSPDAATIRAAEEDLLGKLDRLPPHELVALLRQGMSTRGANLVAITLENAARGPRRSAYEDALLAGMERVSEQPDKLAVLSEATLRFHPSRENAEVAARLLMKSAPAGRLAEHLGAFASRLEAGPRSEVKQFAVRHELIEALGHLVDDWSDVVRLEGYLVDPATRDRAERALERASRSVTGEELRQQIRGALGEAGAY